MTYESLKIYSEIAIILYFWLLGVHPHKTGLYWHLWVGNSSLNWCPCMYSIHPKSWFRKMMGWHSKTIAVYIDIYVVYTICSIVYIFIFNLCTVYMMYDIRFSLQRSRGVHLPQSQWTYGNLRTVNSRAFTDCTAVRLLCRYTLIAIWQGGDPKSQVWSKRSRCWVVGDF